MHCIIQNTSLLEKKYVFPYIAKSLLHKTTKKACKTWLNK